MLAKLANSEITESQFKQYFKTRSRRMNIVSLLLTEKWCIDKHYKSVYDLEKNLPEIYNKVMDGSYDAIFSKYNFKDKTQKQVVPREFIQHFVRVTTSLDKPNLTAIFDEDEEMQEPDEVASKLLSLHKRNTWEKCSLIKINSTCHLVVKGTLNDADILRPMALTPDLIYLNYNHTSEGDFEQDFNRLAYQFPGGKLNECASLVFGSSTVRETCRSHLANDLKMRNFVPALYCLRTKEDFQDKSDDFLLVFPNSRSVPKKHTRKLFVFDDVPTEAVRSSQGTVLDEKQVPLDMDVCLIQFLTRRSSLVISVFAGVGTPACAAAMCGRHSISFEPEDEKYGAIVDRLYATKSVTDADCYMEPIAVPLKVMNDSEFKKACDIEIKKHILTLQKKEYEKKRQREVDVDEERSIKRICQSPSYSDTESPETPNQSETQSVDRQQESNQDVPESQEANSSHTTSADTELEDEEDINPKRGN